MVSIKKLLLFFVLFLVFFAYRVHFWEEFSWHVFLNAFSDTVFSVLCGLFLFILNSRYPLIHRWLFMVSAIVMVVFSFLLYGIHTLIYQFFLILDQDFKPMFEALCFQLLDSVSVIITGTLVYMLHLTSAEKKSMQEDIKQLAIAKDKAELNYLKSQIEPHFIFNGLNTIYHEIKTDNWSAKKYLLQFSDIMRYHLQYASCERVNFDIELQYLQSYINFQYQRSADFLELEQEFMVDDPETEIEPLLILPFVENAFKFCSAIEQNKGYIKVKMKFNRNRLSLELSNSYDPEYRKKQPGSGFGLKNVVKRLGLLYPDRFNLKINDLFEQNIYQCHLEIMI